MLTKSEIEAKLRENPDWEPDSSAPDEVWDLYYEVLDAMEFEDDQYEDEDKDADDYGNWDDDDDDEDTEEDDEDYYDDETDLDWEDM